MAVSSRASASANKRERVFTWLVLQIYSFGSAGGAGASGRSVLKMSATTFHLPSACFFQTSTNLPWSFTGLPCRSFMVSRQVPSMQARSLERATSTLFACQEILVPGPISEAHTA